MSDYETILAEVQAQRLQPRPMLVRIGAVAGGALLTLVGLVIVLPIPEGGVPLILVGLRLLAYQFEWAARWYAKVRFWWLKAKAWWKAKPKWMREVIGWGAVAVIVLILWAVTK